jgi:response regulator RpfG family c-di-GMP phosphodiesterase
VRVPGQGLQRNFLIVAADGKVREALAADLREQGFTVTLAASGSEAERVVRSVSVDKVVIEDHLPDTAGDRLRKRLCQARPDCRVILLSSFKLVRNSPELLRFGADDYLMRGNQLSELLRASSDPVGAPGLGDRGNQSLVQIIDVLVGLIEIENRLFGSSSHQATQLARATAEEMHADEVIVHEVILGTLLRDVGRAAVDSDASVGAVQSAEERNDQPGTHVSASLRLFEHIDFPWKVLPVIRHHHECYDGSGAPDGLRGREIPMAARIVAVVDSYVARTAGSHDDPQDPETALGELVRGAGHQFDPEVVEAFHRVMDKRLAGRKSKKKPVVLVMEPDQEFRRLLKMRLLNDGLAVEEATTYEGALERLLKKPPALVMIDVDTDQSEAFQVLQEMQQDDKLVKLPVIFLAGRPDRVLKLRALRLGVDEFVGKNDDLEEVIVRVENILTREAIRSEGELMRARRGITGSLENLSLPDIMQMLTIGMKTACVSIKSNGSNGKVWIESGSPKHAKAGKLEGEGAFYEMVRWAAGEFVIEHGVKSKKNSIEHDAMFLLMESLRLMDEASAKQAVGS